MHLLAAQSGIIGEGATAVDLRQDPADIVVLSAADSELTCLARAYDTIAEPKPTRLASPSRFVTMRTDRSSSPFRPLLMT